MALVSQYNVDKITNGTNGFGALFCKNIFSATLGAGADTAIAVPLSAATGSFSPTSKNRWLAVISCTPAIDTFMAVNAAATVPAGAAFAATSAALVNGGHTARNCTSGDTLHFISAGTPSVTVEFYAIQE